MGAGRHSEAAGGRAGEGSPSRLHDALAALVRPLDFAARDDFAHIDRVRNLGAAVSSACEHILALSLPEDFRHDFEGLRDTFSNELEPSELITTVARALEALAPLREPGWAERVLARPVSVLPGIGPKRAESLSRRGLGRVGDLLFHLPSRYEDRRSLVHVGELEVGRRATFIAEVKLVDFVTSRNRGKLRRMLQAVVGDDTGTINLKWFRGGDAIVQHIKKDGWLLITGDVKRYRFSKELVHPEIEPIDTGGAAPESGAREKTSERAGARERGEASAPTDSARASDEASGGAGGQARDDVDARADSGDAKDTATVDEAALRQVVPQYSVPEGVNYRTLRRLIGLAVEQYADLVVGYLPPALVRERGLPSTPDALRAVHGPAPEVDFEAYGAYASAAHQRLVLEELYLLELGLALRRQAQGALPGIAIDVADARVVAASTALPFTLTDAQSRVLREIHADLARPHPMNRLVQGDVGSGKTAVALLAAVAVARSGGQTALMAPTELLAEQHARTLRGLTGEDDSPLALRVALLTASVPRDESRRILEQLESGEIDLVVGTHALVQDQVRYARLALAVIDEQHRFGVRQRAALAARGPDGRHPHCLVMTATPIPRTLALTLYGDLDLSVIDELPPGRTAVETLLLREGEGRRITSLVAETVKRGEQVYVVYPLVEESEKIDLRSAMESAERIRHAFPDAGVELVHGRLEAAERAAVMARFAAGESRILVATTVIEVGVDVPSATLMVVEHAERFGLAQLHQLRGRVGRGERPGTCLLVARGGGEKGEARLRAMLETTDGFAIADADLSIRGPGEFLGTRQSGHLPDLKVADLLRDTRLLAAARQAAFDSVRADPGLRRATEARRAVEERWGDRLALVGVG
jgi:ATP-dependent DNA helicase RecG